ncbi:hypothetical protein B0T17DRAFT_482127 [Bombardia bombarda]|uniref:Uncharacterized protein n=1 Tax=Bombardia bombarda TaxID=252184 RepID=A0AA40CEM2_9PEZI|nr:hypothetical protein B0T17DRAFT_482127 [Bombardia bombarda]
MTDSSARQWILVLSLTALLLSLAVIVQVAGRYVTAYLAAPSEVSAFVDCVDSTIAENESYDLDIAKVQRIEDKVRLGRLLQDIQKRGDALREDVNLLLVGEDDSRLRTSSRLFWAARRLDLQEKVRQLDMLRMRFLVVQMGIVASAATAASVAAKQELSSSNRTSGGGTSDPEKSMRLFSTPPRPSSALSRAMTDGPRAKTPLRRLSTQAIRHNDNAEGGHRMGWVGVVQELQELQKSPSLHKRHVSTEMATEQTR